MFDILDAVLERAQARGAADVEVFGESSAAEAERYRAALGITEPLALAAAAAFAPPAGALDPEAEAKASYDALRGTLRYKTRAFAGPRVSCISVIFLLSMLIPYFLASSDILSNTTIFMLICLSCSNRLIWRSI